MPPAIFPAVLGALGLAMAWRYGASAFSLSPAMAELMAGAIVATAWFAVTAYAGKLVRRPTVLFEELTTLPGRAGVAAGVLCLYLLSVLSGPSMGRVIMFLALVLHLIALGVLVLVLRRGPAEQRMVTPVWHMHFTGVIVAAVAAQKLGWDILATSLFWPAMVVAVMVYFASARQALAARVPSPLRPLLAIHLAPVALFGMATLGFGWIGTATTFAWIALAGMLLLGVSARWLLAERFSPFWGALTFPAAATAGLWVSLWRAEPTEFHRIIAGILLIVATLIVLPILFAVLKLWAQGRLAVKTNAAIA